MDASDAGGEKKRKRRDSLFSSDSECDEVDGQNDGDAASVRSLLFSSQPSGMSRRVRPVWSEVRLRLKCESSLNVFFSYSVEAPNESVRSDSDDDDVDESVCKPLSPLVSHYSDRESSADQNRI